jgi:hypothetical protein
MATLIERVEAPVQQIGLERGERGGALRASRGSVSVVPARAREYPQCVSNVLISWRAGAIAASSSAAETIIDAVRAVNTKVIILVAQIIPLNPTQYSCSECPGRVQTLNIQIASWAPGVATADSPVVHTSLLEAYDGGVETAELRRRIEQKCASPLSIAEKRSGRTAPRA